ncbi:MAG: hypothetical protein ACI9EZ_000640, partial [Halobacteriales archaeon]
MPLSVAVVAKTLLPEHVPSLVIILVCGPPAP